MGAINEPERTCIIDERKTEIYNLFLECGFSKLVVEEWIANWQGNALGNFAVALMNAIETQGDPYSNPIGQVRAVVAAFQQHAAEIIQQMCYINVQGKVVARRIVDTETKTELARYAVDFHGGATAYIPLDTNAEDRLRAMELPTLPRHSREVVRAISESRPLPSDVRAISESRPLPPNADVCIPMQMAEAITLGILDPQTVEKIDYFPTVCPNPDWTYWHQLQCFFAHYPRDVDAPMQWSDEYLTFWMPPKMHPNVKRLLLTSTYLSDQRLRKVFPSEEMDVIRAEPTAWVPGNRVFQIRTSSKSLHVIQNYDSNSGVIELSKTGERYFLGIRAEIDRDLSIKHAIVTNGSIMDKLADLAAKQNVCVVANFKTLHKIEANIEAVQVLWIVGTPYYSQREIWQQAQMLFGNDEKPLNYEAEIWTSHYKDERIQGVYNQNAAGLLTQVVGRVGLNRSSGKTVMLLNNFELPDITDRAETLLFDWEDFEIADGLHKLGETIRTRERFEAERDNLTAESSREEVERVLGCSSRQANRMLQKLRGGNIPRITLREQISFFWLPGVRKQHLHSPQRLIAVLRR